MSHVPRVAQGSVGTSALQARPKEGRKEELQRVPALKAITSEYSTLDPVASHIH